MVLPMVMGGVMPQTQLNVIVVMERRMTDGEGAGSPASHSHSNHQWTMNNQFRREGHDEFIVCPSPVADRDLDSSTLCVSIKTTIYQTFFERLNPIFGLPMGPWSDKANHTHY